MDESFGTLSIRSWYRSAPWSSKLVSGRYGFGKGLGKRALSGVLIVCVFVSLRQWVDVTGHRPIETCGWGDPPFEEHGACEASLGPSRLAVT